MIDDKGKRQMKIEDAGGGMFASLKEEPELGAKRFSGLMRGEPLVRKLAVFAKYLVLPGAMAAALVYSPPDYVYYKNDDKSSN